MEHAIITDTKKRMDASVHSLTHSLNGLRTGRASVALLDPVKVEAYGSPVPISQVGTVSTPEAQMITVQVWDGGLVQAVIKAINEAGLGLNPMPDGQLVRIPIPQLSEERRKELSKKALEYGENAKIAIRNVRRDGMDGFKKLEKEKKISEDECRDQSELVQKTTDDFVKKIDLVVAEKQKEIMAI